MGDETVSHAADDDDETLVPHADVYQNGNGQEPWNTGSNLLEKEKERNQTVSHHHDPEFQAVIT